MEISQSSLIYMLLWSFLLGAVLGVLYDVFRIIRVFLSTGDGSKSSFAIGAIDKLRLPWLDKEKIKRRLSGKRRALSILFFLLDVIYALLCGCAFILLEYYMNDGVPRAFSLFGVVCGFVLYYFSLGKAVYALSERISLAIFIILSYISLPFERILAILKNGISKIKHRILLKRTERIAREFDKRRRKELMIMAESAFLELSDK